MVGARRLPQIEGHEQRRTFFAGVYFAASFGRGELREIVTDKLGICWRQLQRSFQNLNAKRKPRSTSSAVRQRRKMIKKLASKVVTRAGIKYPLHPSSPSIQAALPAHARVSRWQVRRDALQAGLVSRVRRMVPTRDPKVLAKRVEFSKTMEKWSNAQLAKIVFSDETVRSTNDFTARRMFVPLLDAQDKILPRSRQKIWNVGSVQVWAAVGVGFKSKLVIFPKRDGTVGWRLNADRYKRRCLQPIIADLLNKKRVLQQDGARAHTANVIMKYLRKKGVSVLLNWPPYSPDLNCIEVVWAVLQRRCALRYATSQEELERIVQEEWDKITQAEIDDICMTFKRRCKECVARKGGCVSK